MLDLETRSQQRFILGLLLIDARRMTVTADDATPTPPLRRRHRHHDAHGEPLPDPPGAPRPDVPAAEAEGPVPAEAVADTPVETTDENGPPRDGQTVAVPESNHAGREQARPGLIAAFKFAEDSRRDSDKP